MAWPTRFGRDMSSAVFARENNVNCLRYASWVNRHVSRRKRLLCDVIFGSLRVLRDLDAVGSDVGRTGQCLKHLKFCW